MNFHPQKEHVPIYDDDSDAYDYDDDDDYGLPIAKGKHKCNICSDEPIFSSLSAYEDHMSTEHNPYICEPCKKDFESQEDLIYHKIRSPLHVICVDCHVEFKSQGGMTLHRKQMHKKDKPVECPGCNTPFPTASALIQHIEQDQCIGHSKAALEASILNSQIALDKLASAGVGPPANSVRVLNHVDESVIQKEKLGMSAATTQMQAMVGKAQAAALTFDEEKQLAQLQRETWSEYEKQYICPDLKCRKKFRQLTGIWQHLSTDVHRAKNFRCPGCHNSYKISSALIQHIESAACKAKTMKEGRALITELSGGIVKD